MLWERISVTNNLSVGTASAFLALKGFPLYSLSWSIVLSRILHCTLMAMKDTRFKSKPAGQQRTFKVIARFKPHAKESILAKLEQMKKQPGKEKFTISDLVRLAVWAYCKEPDDPRTA